MPHALRPRSTPERGFTLVEVLVVILLVGILAAIALPAFLGERAKGQDAAAKSDLRNALAHVESCFAEKQTYAECTGAAADGATPGVTMTVADATGSYALAATSESGNVFRLEHDRAAGDNRSCSTSGGTDKGGCDGGSW